MYYKACLPQRRRCWAGAGSCAGHGHRLGRPGMPGLCASWVRPMLGKCGERAGRRPDRWVRVERGYPSGQGSPGKDWSAEPARRLDPNPILGPDFCWQFCWHGSKKSCRAGWGLPQSKGEISPCLKMSSSDLPACIRCSAGRPAAFSCEDSDWAPTYLGHLVPLPNVIQPAMDCQGIGLGC